MTDEFVKPRCVAFGHPPEGIEMEIYAVTFKTRNIFTEVWRCPECHQLTSLFKEPS